MDDTALAKLKGRAERDSLRLAEHERDHLAVIALTLGYVQRATITGDYLREVKAIIRDLAPTFHGEINHLLDTLDTYHRRMHP